MTGALLFRHIEGTVLRFIKVSIVLVSIEPDDCFLEVEHLNTCTMF